MRIIINGFHHKADFPIVLNILNHFKVDYCKIIYHKEKIVLPAFTRGDYLECSRLLQKCDYNVDWNKLIPLDEKCLVEMYPCEAVVLKMMDRLKLDPMSYDERKAVYLKHLRYWNHVIETEKIDLFISINIPHEVYDYIIYSLCRKNNIPTIFFYQSQIEDTVHIMTDWEKSTEEIKEEYQKMIAHCKGINIEEIELKERFKRDYDSHVDPNIKPTPFYMKEEDGPIKHVRQFINQIKRLNKLNNIARFSSLPTEVIKLLKDMERNYNWKKLSLFYDKKSIKPDLSKKYVYFALQYQPELTTSPIGGAYVEQLLMAQMASYLLPPNHYIYIKEHPKQTGQSRSKQLYGQLLDMPNVVFVPRSYDTFTLIDNSMAVMTVSGTVGWEALYKGKPVLMFGHNFYQYAPGVHLITTFDDCRNALEKILLGGAGPSERDMKIFLKALENTTIEGYTDQSYNKISMLTPENNVENISQALIAKIRQLTQ